MLIVAAIVAMLFVLFTFPTIGCAMSNILSILRYGPKDFYEYIRKTKWIYRTGQIIGYVGLFGKGKTLSAVHKVVGAYEQYNGKKVYCKRRNIWVTQRIHILSNVKLQIPYEEFVSLEQINGLSKTMDAYDDEHGTLTIALVLGDEFSVQMNSREFKKNIDPLFLNTLLTCRHHRISLFYTAQRFGHVDALLRQVTGKVISCEKLWRFQRYSIYDAWDMENSPNPQMVKPLRRGCWFVRDKDYNAYDTLACVGNLKKSVEKGDMLSEEDILNLQRNQPSDMESVARPSRQWTKRAKRSKK